MRRRFINNRRFDIDSYLTIEALGSVSILFSGNTSLEYTINGSGWIEYEDYTELYIRTGQTISFRGETEKGIGDVGRFQINGNCNLRGNCMSILFGDKANLENSIADFPDVFNGLFLNCGGIISVSKNFLPATTLATSCYDSMFEGCRNLVNAPELPATTLVQYCYYNMFSECTSLEVAPELPVTTLLRGCYLSMFFGCTNLNYIKMLATDISASYCLQNWVYGVASTGIFVKSKDATWDVVGVSGVPTGWVVLTDEFGDLIEFTVDGTVYQAQEGMTWADFIDSTFNPSTGNHFVLHGGIVMVLYNYVGEMTTSPQTLVQLNGINMLPSDLIISGGSYTTKTAGGLGN